MEEKNKKMVLDIIISINSKQNETINLIKTNLKNMGQLDNNIPNTAITVNNKLVELSQEFKRHGISMLDSDFGIPLVGSAITNDLISKLAMSTEKLEKYNKNIETVVENTRKQEQALQNISPIKKFFSKIRSFFVTVKPKDLSLTEEEKIVFNSPLEEYKDIDNQIWNYNIRDNIVSSIVSLISEQGYETSRIQEMLDEDIIPDLEKLGLVDLVPELQKTLDEMNSKKRKLNENGIDLEDFELIDNSVSALNRQEAIKTIKDELHEKEESTQEKYSEIDDMSL